MNIKYIANARIPTPRAQGYAIAKMCSEFAKSGAEVTLCVPHRTDVDLINKDPFDFYQIERNFEIKRIPNLDLLSKTWKFGRVFYWIDILFFLIASKFLIKIEEKNVIYTRDFLVSLFFTKNSFLELHDITSKSFLFKWAIKKPKLFFVLNSHLKKELMELGIPGKKVFIFPSGIDHQEFQINMSKKEAREKINLPQYKKIILYSGQFYAWKGTDTLAEVAKLLPEYLFVFVGGVEPELSQFGKKYGKFDNIIFLSFQERSNIPVFLKSADVLVLPNSAREKISARYTSPLKLFEYMASKKPIVASDLPSIREIINESECFFAEADNPKSFAQAIERILSDKEFADKIARNAFGRVQKYSWRKRAENILATIKHELLSEFSQARS